MAVLSFIGYACGSDRSPVAPQDFAAAVATVPFEVTVVAPDGRTPVAGATVRAYTANGPVATSLATGPSGVVTLDLAPGNYCLSARTVPAGWQSMSIVAPPTVPAADPSLQPYAPVVSNGSKYVSFSGQSFRECYMTLPVKVNQNGGKQTVRMGAPVNVLPKVFDLTGTEIPDVSVYAVVPLDETPPWIHLPAGSQARPAFLSAFDVTSLAADLVVPEGVKYALEFQQVNGAFNITGTLKNLTAGKGNTTQTPSIEANPLMCRQTMEVFPAGEAGIDFLKANYGYHARPTNDVENPLAVDHGTAAVQLIQTGSGPVTLTLRTDLPQGRWTTTVDYICADGTCTTTGVKRSGGNTQQAYVYHMRKPDGSVKTTVVLTGIPSDHVALSFSAKSPGDAVPLTSRSDDTAAYIVVPMQTRCVVELSNDDKWSIGDI